MYNRYVENLNIKMTAIPKRIFYVWSVNDTKKRDVLVCMLSWRVVLQGYEIIEINEESKIYFDFKRELEENRWFRTVYDRKMWAYVADYIRLKVLYQHGGIYLDTDVSVLKRFDDFLNDKCFVGIQCSKLDGRDNLVEPAILGSQKGNLFIKKILDFYDENSLENIWNMPIFILPKIFKFFLEKDYGVQSYPIKSEQDVIEYNEIKIYPESIFIPFRWREEFNPECVTDKTVTVHWFGGSWLDERTQFF